MRPRASDVQAFFSDGFDTTVTAAQEEMPPT
jgi:hypothetical protein